jgi:hypothetical protein
MARFVHQAGAQMLSEERFQEAADFIVVADGVKVEQRRRFQCEKQSESSANSALVNAKAAALGREIANSNAGMQMWLAEVFLNALNQLADACPVRFRPTTKFASEIFGEISAIKLLRSSPGIFWRVRSRFLLSLWHAGCERSFSFRRR